MSAPISNNWNWNRDASSTSRAILAEDLKPRGWKPSPHIKVSCPQMYRFLGRGESNSWKRLRWSLNSSSNNCLARAFRTPWTKCVSPGVLFVWSISKSRRKSTSVITNGKLPYWPLHMESDCSFMKILGILNGASHFRGAEVNKQCMSLFFPFPKTKGERKDVETRMWILREHWSGLL